MGSGGRLALGVIAGVTAWSVLWVAGTAAAQAALPELLDPARRLEHVGALLGYLAYSVVLSVFAGWTAAAVAGAERAMRAAWTAAAILLALGVYFEISYWDLLPVWYHLAFLALLVPATAWGGRLNAR